MKLKQFLKAIDSFGQPIHLVYKGGATYRTALGGLLTILYFVAILAYFLFQLSLAIKHNYTLSIS